MNYSQNHIYSLHDYLLIKGEDNQPPMISKVHDIVIDNIYLSTYLRDDETKNEFVFDNVKCKKLFISHGNIININPNCEIDVIVIQEEDTILNSQITSSLIVSKDDMRNKASSDYYFNREIKSNNTIVPVLFNGHYIFPEYDLVLTSLLIKVNEPKEILDGMNNLLLSL